MKTVKLAIIYYSSTGTNYAMAKSAEKAAKNLGLEHIRFKRIEETVPEELMKNNEDWLNHYQNTKSVPVASVDDLEWADAILFLSPTRYGDLPSQVKSLIDATGPLWQKGKLVNKVVSGMTSAANPHGGQEATLLSLYKTMMHWGAIIAAPGYADPIQFEVGGNPYGFSVKAGTDLSEKQEKAIAFQVERTLSIAHKINA